MFDEFLTHNASIMTTIRLLTTCALLLLLLSGCAEIVANRILHGGSNGGGTPFPKPLQDSLPIAHLNIVRVQQDPAIDLAVWVLEPHHCQVWTGNGDIAIPNGWVVAGKVRCDLVDHGPSAKVYPFNFRWFQEKPGTNMTPAGTVILLQGQGGCARTSPLLLFALVLADAGYRVVMPDLRSQGDSTGKELGFIVKDAQDVSKILDWLQREHLLAGRVGIFGHSYGAAVAGYAAAKDDRIATCIVSGGPTNWRKVIQYQGRESLLWRLMSDRQRERAFQICSEKMGYDIDSLDGCKLITSTDKPVLLLHGRKDKNVPVALALAAYEARPKNTRLVIFEEAGHYDYLMTDFERVRKLCLDWFAEHLRPPTETAPSQPATTASTSATAPVERGRTP